MTAQQPPTWMSGESHSAEVLRRTLGATVGPGIMRADDMEVTEKAGTPNLSVDVAGGIAAIVGTDSTYQGTYVCDNRGTANVVLATADGSNPRKDLIVARVRDSVYSGANDDWDIVAVTGTPASSPSEPTAPDNSITLAVVAVAASATSILDANITDRRSISRPWNASWGMVGYKKITSNSAAIGTATTVIPALTVPLVAGRRYSVSTYCKFAQTAAGTGVENLFIFQGASQIANTAEYQQGSSTTRGHVMAGLLVEPSTTGDVDFTVKATASNAAVVSATGNGPSWIMVEDIGPV